MKKIQRTFFRFGVAQKLCKNTFLGIFLSDVKKRSRKHAKNKIYTQWHCFRPWRFIHKWVQFRLSCNEVSRFGSSRKLKVMWIEYTASIILSESEHAWKKTNSFSMMIKFFRAKKVRGEKNCSQNSKNKTRKNKQIAFFTLLDSQFSSSFFGSS